MNGGRFSHPRTRGQHKAKKNAEVKKMLKKVKQVLVPSVDAKKERGKKKGGERGKK